jgi:hypothetical protein
MAYQELMPVGVNLQPGGKYKIGDTVVLDENGVYVPVPSSQLDADLGAIAGLSGVGLAVRTANNTWALRSITGTANQVIVQNGDGVSGNVLLSTPQNLHAQATPTFSNVTLTPVADGDPVVYVLNKKVGGAVSEAGRLKWRPDFDVLLLARTDVPGYNELQTGIAIHNNGDINAVRNIRLQGNPFNAFTLRLRNNAGVIEHAIVSMATPDSLAGSSFVSNINGASASWAATPDGGTYTNGVKFYDSNSHHLIGFDTSGEDEKTSVMGVVTYNSSGTPILAETRTHWFNILIGGQWVNRNVFAVILRNATDGTNFPVTTTNLPDGKEIRIAFFGYI